MNNDSNLSITPLIVASTTLATALFSPSFGYQSSIPTECCKYANSNIGKLYFSRDFLYNDLSNTLYISESNAEIGEPIIQLDTIKKLKIKIRQPTLLKFVSVQDTEGFY